MNNQALNRLCLCIAICTTLNVAAQEIPINEPDYGKPKLFKEQSEKVSIIQSLDFSSIVRLRVGQSVNIPFSTDFSFAGTIVSVSDNLDPNVKSVVVKSPSKQGAVLTLTEITKEDKTIAYVGRIISQQHGDALELVQEQGKYSFKKKGLYDLISE